MGECPKCKGTGLADSGGVQSWGAPILIECDCKFEQAIMEQMRSDFEAWISNLSRGCADLHVNIYGDYDDPQVIPYWEAWQASRAAGLRVKEK